MKGRIWQSSSTIQLKSLAQKDKGNKSAKKLLNQKPLIVIIAYRSFELGHFWQASGISKRTMNDVVIHNLGFASEQPIAQLAISIRVFKPQTSGLKIVKV